MNPTLVEPLLMEIIPGLPENSLCPGDVILFQLPGQDHATVHRILRMTSLGMVTCGDNNPLEDPIIVPACHIIGKVVAGQRGPRRSIIHGGQRGLQWHYLLRLWRVTARFIQHRFHRVYRGLARSGVIAARLPPSLTPRVATFQRRGMVVYQLMLRKQVIGEYDPKLKTWRIRPPYRLLVAEDKLPTPGNDPNG